MGINIQLNVPNPFFKGEDEQSEIYYKSKTISKHKFFEIELDKVKNSDYAEFRLSAAMGGQDHAGIELSLQVGSLYFSTCLRDSRHWNYSGNCWMMDSKEWFLKFKKQLDKDYPGSYILFNNVSDYYQDGLTPEKAVEKFLVDDNIENYFYNGSGPSVIPDIFIAHAEIDNGICKSVVLDEVVLKYYNSPRIDITYNGNPVEIVNYESSTTCMNNPPVLMGDVKDYRDYEVLDRSLVRDVRIVIDPNTFDPIYSLTLDGTYPRMAIQDCFVSKLCIRVIIRYANIHKPYEGYIPKIYYK